MDLSVTTGLANGSIVADRLTCIVGYAKLLERGGLSDAERRDFGVQLREQADALGRMLTKYHVGSFSDVFSTEEGEGESRAKVPLRDHLV